MQVNRIVTHTDFDGLICAVLYRVIFDVEEVVFTEPSEVQYGRFLAQPGDAFADLPLPKEGCAVWIDHHEIPDVPEVSTYHLDPERPSCAGYIYDLYKDKHDLSRFEQLVKATDVIDSANYTEEDIRNPDDANKLALALLRDRQDDDFRRKLIDLLVVLPVEDVVQHPLVQKRYDEEIAEQKAFIKSIPNHTKVVGKVIFTDTIGKNVHGGSPFLLYLEFPGIPYSMKIKEYDTKPDLFKISVAKNVFMEKPDKDLGALMRRIGGGGHPDAAGCSIPRRDGERVVKEILDELNA